MLANVKKEDVYKIIKKIDLNNDGIIEWDEFLQSMFNWLSSIGLLKQNSSEDIDTLPHVLFYFFEIIINNVLCLLAYRKEKYYI